MERTIQLVQPMKLAERKLLRVAAYARVSCDKDAMKHSLAAQISYYNEYIQRHSDWVFAGIYADEAYSGTKDDRPRFVQLIQDCKDGKIDRIAGDEVAYPDTDGTLYTCQQAHMSQVGWEPPAVPALWTTKAASGAETNDDTGLTDDEGQTEEA